MNESKTCRRRKAHSSIIGLLILTGIMMVTVQLPIEDASGQIIESFEGGLGSWVGESNWGGGFWDVAPSSTYAFDGSISISMWNHGMPDTQLVWIEKSIPVPSGQTRNVEMTFQLYCESPLKTPQNVTAYIGPFNPSVFQLTKIGETDQVIGWNEYNYSNIVTSGPIGNIYVAIGVGNYDVGSGRYYYFDYVILTNVSYDMSPPLFTNLTPPDGSYTGNTMPTIGANYTDPSGMNISTVLMEVDGIDVTGSSTIDPTGIEYTPAVPLSEGPHTVYIEARDASINRNYGNVTWIFTVDTSPPIISNLQPPDLSTTTDNTPNISADYTDPAGINITTVMLEVDGIDVTAPANLTLSNVTYTPTNVLADGVHNVYLEVEDAVGNLGTASWSFTVDTLSDGTPPTITNLNPVNLSTIGETFPQISANYSDYSGINVTTVYLEVDMIDVTSQATINTDGIEYNPSVALSEGLHNIFLSVEDDSINHNLATVSWEFTIEDTPPVTTLIVGNPGHSAGGTEYFTSATTFTLSADDGGGTGVNSTWFRTWDDATGWTPLTKYMNPFTFSGGDGTRYIEYNSTDNVTNHETPNNYSVISMLYLDNSAPVSAIALGNPTFVSGPDTYITDSTEVNLSATDVAGIGGIWYKIDVGGSWTLYNGNFTIATEGTRTIYFNATDNVGNSEVSQTMTVIVDNTPPATLLSLGTPVYVSSSITYFTSATQFTLSATDAGSGVASILHMTWEIGIGWTPLNPYSSPFTLSGSDGLRFIEYGSEDNLTNQEVAKNHTSISGLYLDNSDPVTILTIGPPNHISGPDTFVSHLTEFNLTAWDATGAEYVRYRIDAGGLVAYTGNFTITTEGSHAIYYNATDYLGNSEAANSKVVIVDKTAPDTTIGFGTPTAGTAITIINSSTEITLTPDDGTGSGVAETFYSIGIDPFTLYTGPFTLSGRLSDQHTIQYYSVDNVDNTEIVKTEIVLLDDAPPTAVAGSDVSIMEGEIVNFDASLSADNSGLISDYYWTFTYEGLPITLDGVNPTYGFNETGNYLVTLTATDAIGNSGTDTMWINVSAIADSDNDGLPDSWEEEYFGNLDQDADDDPDNDGFDNLDEYNNGTDPTVSDKEEPPSEFPWWLILVAVIIILFLILLLLLLKRRKSDEEQEEVFEEDTEEETEEVEEELDDTSEEDYAEKDESETLTDEGERE
jgi:hypothetical protein